MVENLGGLFILILLSSYALAVLSKRTLYGKHISLKNFHTEVDRRGKINPDSKIKQITKMPTSLLL